MKAFFQKTRTPDKRAPLKSKIIITVIISLFGFLIGVFQKYIDSVGFDSLPLIFQKLDIVNFFGRFAIWILIASAISVYAKTPLRASVNTFFFLTSMVLGYYLYCNFILDFLPVRYMTIWFAFAAASFFLGYVCWYAKGNGILSIIISAAILGVLFSQAFLITQGFYVTHLAEVIVWLAGVLMLYRKPKEFALELTLSVAVAFVYQLMIPYWG